MLGRGAQGWLVVLALVCGVSTMGTPAALATSPDPGGQESPDQAVPYPGKAFGFNSNMTLNATATADQELDAVQEAGGSYLRLGIGWRYLQPAASNPPLPPAVGDNTVARLDALYARAEARGVRLVLIPYSAPLWATKYASCGLLDTTCKNVQTAYNKGNAKLFPDSPHLPQWRAFIRAVKQHWPNAWIEPWNEPNLYYTLQPWVVSPEEFKSIQCNAYAASKEINGDPVLAAGWASNQYSTFVGRVYAAGGKDCWDIANVHIYYGSQTTFGAGSSMANQLDAVRTVRTQYSETDPLWVTETGYTTTGSFAVSEATQADALNRAYNRLVTMPDVGGVFVHTTRDNQFGDVDPSGPEYGYGLLRADWSPKPAYCHFAAMSGGSWTGCS